MRAALVTSVRLPEEHWRDIDADPLASALTGRGVAVDRAPWDAGDPVDWSSYDAVVVQSPWSMWLRMAEFRAWLADREADGSRLLNPVDVVRLGSDKRYLGRLADAGVPTVRTTFFEPGVTEAEVRDGIAAALPPPGSARPTVVVKPVSSGGALGIGEFAGDRLEEAVTHARTMLSPGPDAP